jgi:hypothetical protein
MGTSIAIMVLIAIAVTSGVFKIEVNRQPELDLLRNQLTACNDNLQNLKDAQQVQCNCNCVDAGTMLFGGFLIGVALSVILSVFLYNKIEVFKKSLIKKKETDDAKKELEDVIKERDSW